MVKLSRKGEGENRGRGWRKRGKRRKQEGWVRKGPY